MAAALLFVPGSIALGLGVWQVQRMEWKKSEVRLREQRLAAAPDAVEAVLARHAEGGAPPAHTPVICEGTFMNDKSIFVGPRVRSEMGQAFSGYQLVTPMRLAPPESSARRGGWGFRGSNANDAEAIDVLVLRGWVPDLWRRDPTRFEALQPSGKVQVRGLVRHSDRPGYFVPPNDPIGKQWFFYDAADMVSAALASACAPLGPVRPVALPTTHLAFRARRLLTRSVCVALLGQARTCGVAAGGTASDRVLIEAIRLDDKQETARVNLNTSRDVLAFRTDRNRWRPGGASASDGAADPEVTKLMHKLNASSLPIQKTLGDFMRFSVTPRECQR